MTLAQHLDSGIQLSLTRWRVVTGGGDTKVALSGGFFTKAQAEHVCAKLKRKHPGARVEEGQ